MQVLKKSSKLLIALTITLWTGIASAMPMYVTAVWDTNSVHLLDENFESISSFSTGSTQANGVTTDGTFIYTGHFSSQEVIAYDLLGVEQFRWSASLPGLQGMAIVGSELAVAQAGNIDFFDPATGAFIRSTPGASPSTEGLAFDGTNLWALDAELAALDPLSGAINFSIANAASACSFDGTGMASAGAGQLALACENGDIFVVSDVDGSVISTTNNGLDMFGLSQLVVAAPVPNPATLALLGLGIACLGWTRRKRA